MTLEILDFPIQPFSVETLQNIYKKCKKSVDSDDGEKPLSFHYKSLLHYVNMYYYETQAGNYYYYNQPTNEFQKQTNDEFMKGVMVKIDKSLYAKLFEKNSRIFDVVSRINRPRAFKENGSYCLNECKGYLHKTHKKNDSYSVGVKDKMKMILDMIKEISCDNNDQLYEAYIKYLSQLIKGVKTEVIIYKKSEQGTGKSTETDFLINYVLGPDLCLISGVEPLTTNFNKILLGKLLVVFEELPTFNEREWAAVSSKLKTMTTEKTHIYRGLFKNPIEAENISNFIINTNCESIKDSNGRRIMIMPVSTHRKGDYEYFKQIRDNCFNLEVGECFFSYLMNIDTDKFRAERDFPENNQKRLAIANLLHPVYKFIKNEFVLKSLPLDKVKPKDLHFHYQTWKGDKVMGKNDFMKKLEDVGINYRVLHGNNYYKESLEFLNAIATKNKWICQYDEVEEAAEEEEDNEPSPLDGPIDYKKLYLELKAKMEK